MPKSLTQNFPRPLYALRAIAAPLTNYAPTSSDEYLETVVLPQQNYTLALKLIT
ncbi:hypothetical protein [Microseira sp. BLCC-F43]|uniref:hypothetical protein n=1 Tax=Microseira sp. BLCC-F43 TaxID=3153602 RepID=UPI0035B97740